MQPATTEKPTVTPFPVPWAVKLIDRLHALYGAQFLRQWEGLEKPAMALAWAEELAGYTGDEIARGLAACKSRPFPPTLPEFLLLCRPTLSPEAAYHEAVAGMTARSQGLCGEWSHPGIYWAAVRVTSHDLLSMGWQAIRGRWETALRDVMSKGRWDPVPEPSLSLPAPGKTLATPQEQAKFLATMKRITGSENLTADGRIKGHKAWARKALDSPKGKTETVLRMARKVVEEQGEKA